LDLKEQNKMATKAEWNEIVKTFNDCNMIILEADRRQEIEEAILALSDLIELDVAPEQHKKYLDALENLAGLILVQK